MEIQQKEILLHRILSGVNILTVDNTEFYLKTPSRITRYKAALYYNQVYEDNLFNEWMNREDAEQYLIKLDLVSSAYKTDIEKRNKDIEDTKVEMFKNLYNFPKLKLFKKKLNDNRSILNRMISNYNLIDRFTLEGYCDIQKYQYLIKNSIFDETGNLIICDNKQFERVIGKLSETSISIGDFREMARTEPWRSYWNAYKEDIFGLSGADWNEDQKTIVLFSKMYDNAYKHPECPSDMVINDDDLFDGWSILENRKNEEDKKKKDVNDDKYGNADEVFIMTKNAKEAKQVYDTNSPEARAIIKQRQEALSKHGKLREAELPDVKRDLQMKATRMMAETHKKGR